MTTIRSDDTGAVSIPPDLLRQIGVQPNALVALEVAGPFIVVRPPHAPWPEVEIYTPERKAEFLLNGAVDEEDYQAARKAVRALGLDPDQIPHERPAGV
jgi:antitoxin component of MazEF toxin-antitoxin module